MTAEAAPPSAPSAPSTAPSAGAPTDRPEHPHVGYTVDGDGVATVLLDRPERLNALTPDMTQGYLRTLQHADADAACRVVVVTGAGRGFCAGADLDVLRGGPEVLRSYRPEPGLPVDLGLRIRKPVIAAVNGPSAGIGFALLLASDVRFLAAGARISSTFARLGLVAEYGTAWLLPRLVGLGAATELLLSGRVIGADEALRIGLVHEVVPDERFRERVSEYARELATRCSPRSFAAMKAQLLADATATAEDAVASAHGLMLQSFGWPDLPEGVAALGEKRAPRFGPLPPPGPSDG